jgi:hypothetical protein
VSVLSVLHGVAKTIDLEDFPEEELSPDDSEDFAVLDEEASCELEDFSSSELEEASLRELEDFSFTLLELTEEDDFSSAEL